MVITYIEGMIKINLLPTWEKVVDGYTVTRYDYVPPDEGVHRRTSPSKMERNSYGVCRKKKKSAASA